jgi:hypothetical protein
MRNRERRGPRRTVANAALTIVVLAARAVAAGWLATETLVTATAGDSVTDADVGVGPGGHAAVVWQTNTGVIQTSTREPGGAFVRAVPDLSAPGSGTPAVGIAGDGAALVAWIRGGVVQSASRPAGGVFAGATDVPGSIDGSAPLLLNVDDAGRAMLTWLHVASPDEFEMGLAFRPAGGAFDTADSTGNTVTVDAWEQAFAGNRRGDVVAALWSRRFGIFPPPPKFKSVSVRTGTDGGVAGLSPIDEFFEEPAEALAVGVGPAGEVAVAWRFTEAPERLRIGLGSVTGPIGPPADLPGTGPQSRWPAVAIDATGGTLVVLSEDGVLRSTYRPAGGDFSSPQDVPGVAGNATVSRVAFLPNGDALVVFQDAEQVWAAHRPAGGAFGPAQLLSTPIAFAELPRIAVDDGGDAVATWSEQPGGTSYAVAAAVYDSAAPELRSTSIPATATAEIPAAFAAEAFDRFSVVTFAWSFGDGGSADGGAVQHTFPAAGTVGVTVTATDGAGNATSSSGAVLVSSIEVPACAGVVVPRGIAKKFARADGLARRGYKAAPGKKRTRTIQRAARLMEKVGGATDRAAARKRGPLLANCAAEIRAVVTDAAARFRGLLG